MAGTLSFAAFMLVGRASAHSLIPSLHFALYWMGSAVGVGILVICLPSFSRRLAL